MASTAHNSEERHQDFWEDNILLSEIFDVATLEECPLLSGGLGDLLKQSLTKLIMRTVMDLVSRLMVLPTEDIQAFRLHWEGYSDRRTGDLLGIDHKTAKRKYLSVIEKISEAKRPSGER